jgi:hypothetical protein
LLWEKNMIRGTSHRYVYIDEEEPSEEFRILQKEGPVQVI